MSHEHQREYWDRVAPARKVIRVTYDPDRPCLEAIELHDVLVPAESVFMYATIAVDQLDQLIAALEAVREAIGEP